MPRFFGEQLIASGEIDGEHLRQALDLCDQVNLRIGDLAVREGWMNVGQVQQVLEKQRSLDQRFGEIAVSLDFISEPQLESLLHLRTTSHLYVGEALVQLEFLTRSTLEAQLEQYKGEVATFAEDNHTPVEIRRSRIAAEILEALPRIATRMGRLQVLTHWEPQWIDDPALPHRSWVSLASSEPLVIAIAASNELAEQIAAAMLFCEPDELEPDDVDDAIGEFLNLVVGSAKSALENANQNENDTARLSPPRSDHYPDTGFALQLITNRGPGCLLIQTGPPESQ